MAQAAHSKACCSVLPAQADYHEKGDFVEINGLKTYKSGPDSANTAILVIYDIFGFSPQGFQGADLLAHADKGSGYQVYMPGFLGDEHGSLDDLPIDTPEKLAKLTTFLQGTGAPLKTAGAIPNVIKEIETKAGGNINKWGIVGMCWGGKVVSFSCGPGTPFSAAAQAHPAMVDPNDAPGLTVPLCLIASSGEDPNAIQAFEKNLKVPSEVATFGDQVHGFMAARADLKDAKVRAEFERGYQILLDFFHKHL